eukprot:CAMPEP_0197929404 /NCGR_PEP_ID=MMETSP1439-20131203/103763_1 /TAXON_ID=66791 /ORGANISM="Gonyaulax spinifera, Strain CCMP409" /LENGTH=40 /DNA_ID= /DNA_START= /DNA_END= /DNA_ORIENTATION=
MKATICFRRAAAGGIVAQAVGNAMEEAGTVLRLLDDNAIH